jgi:hypothetical protein
MLCDALGDHRSRETRSSLMKATLEQIWHEFPGQLGEFIRARVADPATEEDTSRLPTLLICWLLP